MISTSLFNYILTLTSNDFSVDDTRECIRILNRFVLKEPLSDDELEVILRDEAFQKPVFFCDKTFLFDRFATWLKNNENVVSISTALDYDRTAKTTKQFFAKVQNKMHYAVHGHTAAELIYERADADKPHMGLTTWAAAPEGKIVKSDVSIAKNYLSEKEMRSLERIVSAYLDLAEDRAERHIPMTMEDWAKRLDLFLMADDREVLQDAGKITAEIAKAKAETEFEKYRVIQDRLFMSDFDKYMLELEKNAKK